MNFQEKENVYLTYNGPFNIQIISGFAKYLSELTIAPHHVRKKLYRVFIELSQNVALYSFDRVMLLNDTDVGKGEVCIIETSTAFRCITTNRIQKEHESILHNNCVDINATPVEILRKKKKELYRLSNFQDTGAHVGLIMIFIYSENPLDFEIFKNENNELYFRMAATINKIDNK